MSRPRPSGAFQGSIPWAVVYTKEHPTPDGWLHQWGYDAHTYLATNGTRHPVPARPAGMICCRCGAFVPDTILERTGAPTAQAVYAQAILAAAGLAPFDVSLDDDTTQRHFAATARRLVRDLHAAAGGWPSVRPAAV